MQGDIKPSHCIPNNDLRKVYRGTFITDFLKASIITDSIKIFSITFRTLVTVYCTYKISSERRFQNCALRYNFSHVALRCSSFRVKTVVCLQQRCTMLYATERQRLRAVNY